MLASTLVLRNSLKRMIQGLIDPANHYVVCATYFEHISPENSELDNHYMAVVYLHQDAAWNLE